MSNSRPNNRVTLLWDASTLSDGVTRDTSVDGYRVHYGEASRDYYETIDVGLNTETTISNLPPTTVYFAVTAYNEGGESEYSDEVATYVPQLRSLAGEAPRLQLK